MTHGVSVLQTWCDPTPTMVLPLPVMKTASKVPPLSCCSRRFSSCSSGNLSTRTTALHAGLVGSNRYLKRGLTG